MESSSPFEKTPQWFELEPIPDRNKTAAPYAAVRLGARYEPFILFLGSGGCVLTKRVSKMLYDLDGRGLVEASVDRRSMQAVMPERRAPTEFSIPGKPSNARIAIAVDTVAGKRIGPFIYRFDAMEILRSAAKTAGAPRLACSTARRSSQGAARRICMAPGRGSALAWMNVRQIRYGPSETGMNSQLPISISERYLLSDGIDYGGLEDGIARFDVPQAWTDVYYRLVLQSGEMTPVVRVPLAEEL